MNIWILVIILKLLIKYYSGDNIEIINKILLDSYKESDNNIDQFENYLDVILNSVNNFYNIDKNNKIEIKEYIYNYLNSKEGLKEKLISKYQYEDVVDYEKFTNIVKENNIAMDETAMEYLLFRMKINEPGKAKMKFREFNFKIFIKFFDSSIPEEDF